MITEQQEKAFQENGYLILERQLSDAWVNALRAAADWWMRLGVLLDQDGVPLSEHGMVRYEEENYIFSVLDLHNKGRMESLELLGSPMVLEPVKRLCGADAVCVIESLEVRRPEDNLTLPWNQRRLHGPEERALVVSVALDTLVEHRGALQFAPHTHEEKQDICAIQRQFGFESEGLIVPALQPGDILIYDTMLACCSPVVREGTPVRTIDFEFSSVQHAVTAAGRSPEWLAQKRDMLEYAEEIYHRLHDGISDEESFASSDTRAELFKNDFGRISSCYAIKTQVDPSHFCLDFKTGERVGDAPHRPNR